MQLAVEVVKFWFVQGPMGLIAYFGSLNNAFLKMFSFQVLTRTYFKPWKNEYRKGLVEFAIFMGMFIKSFLILFDLAIVAVMIAVEAVLTVIFFVWPLFTIYLLTIK